ncbi:hemolysin III family protein [Nocardioides sp. zg-578]|uniref:Hemolysin III family protein n=1 Tax=Nocardioides marmotae TaxID=2663857 RepID=A0A6I3J1H7_9ACTN|nr:hemolysin III family protein [Nocardioides marmotae]MCR6030530.1 hemolysin III family protein [Gordonia jinghuaiqii]MTB86013.1 hemolysin III family protein [Nocardioides marmotae]MTB94166.1 hemolysin III family protein [Nocardioides marmotae]QKE03352.1 hemolysin III family protein [Nocardioides marmotae]
MRAGLENRLEHLGDSFHDTIAEIKPKLRGWLHLASAPLTLVAGIVLVALSPDATTRVGSAVFCGTGLLLFTVSAIYHTGTWSPRTWAFLRRFDHSNIFLLIAGSYTPFALMLLEGGQRATLLSVVWSGALLGVGFRVFWTDAPRWLYVPIYIALGWAAVFFIPGLLDGALELGMGIGVTTFGMIVAGGMLYTLGGVVYGFQRPDPWPHWFGFHEVFHTFTVLAFAAHYVGVSLATYSLR